MRASEYTQLSLAFVFFLGAALTASGVWFGFILSAGSLYAFFKYGMRIKGWIGGSKEEMQKEYDQIENLINTDRHQNGQPLTIKERGKLYDRRERLRESIRQWDVEFDGK